VDWIAPRELFGEEQCLLDVRREQGQVEEL
jgi:hypothetical protein